MKELQLFVRKKTRANKLRQEMNDRVMQLMNQQQLRFRFEQVEMGPSSRPLVYAQNTLVQKQISCLLCLRNLCSE